MKQILVILLLFAPFAFAQEVSEVTQNDWVGLANTLGTLKGAKIMVGITAVIQVVMLALRGPLGHFTGQFRFWIVAGLSLISAFLVEILREPAISFQTVFQAVMSAPVILSAQVLLNQFGKQNLTEKGKH